jgi:hypothetical protein
LTVNPKLLRRDGRRLFRRLVFLCATVAMLAIAPGAGGVPGDPSPPEITPLTTQGTLGSNGWYRTTVTVAWDVRDAESIILDTTGCGASTVSADTPSIQFTCTAVSDGGTASKTRTVKLDKTAPTVGAAAERQPDANGWYNRPLSVSFAGADATSGVAACSSGQYAGPDNAAASVAGTCTDNAGNVGAASLAFKYDATAPSILGVAAKLGNRSAELAWRASPDTRLVQVVRAPGRKRQSETVIYQGTASGFRDTRLTVGRRYGYRVIGVDEAANQAQTTKTVVATGALLSPAPRARVSLKSLPRLSWTPVKGASHYNVQLMRGPKVLSAWPVRPGFQLRRTWIYNGRRYRLRPGVYRWYVWPGMGRISAGRFGRLLGSSTFVVTK